MVRVTDPLACKAMASRSRFWLAASAMWPLAVPSGLSAAMLMR